MANTMAKQTAWIQTQPAFYAPPRVVVKARRVSCCSRARPWKSSA